MHDTFEINLKNKVLKSAPSLPGLTQRIQEFFSAVPAASHQTHYPQFPPNFTVCVNEPCDWLIIE